MGERTQYSPGTFSWTDLTTPDQAGAKHFYSQLFGWEADDQDIGQGMTYSMMKLGGREVCAVSSQPQQQREAGVPPMWNSYITVGSADDALARAERLGATVHAQAFDVFDAGRMGVVQDPQGAFFEVWEPKAHIGAGWVNAPGALSWNELVTSEPDASGAFYDELFGWTTEEMPGEPRYRIIKAADGHTNGSMSAMAPPGTPPHWLVYFGTDDVGATLAKVGELGGRTLLEPTQIGEAGMIAVAQDPQGAAFALYAGRFEE
jgi:uncharacterized protein